MALDRWQQQLCELLEAVHAKQRQYDQASSACQVLLKPWPKKSEEKEAVLKKDASGFNENGANRGDPREEGELKVVNDLLRRAQKTRVKTSSKKLKEDVCPHGDNPATSRSGNELWEICDSESQEIQESVPRGDVQFSNLKTASVIKTSDNLRMTSGSARTESSAKNAPRKQEQRIQYVRESGSRSSQAVNKHHPSTSSIGKPATFTDPKRPKSRDSAESSQLRSRPRSGRGNFKPAHATAPFKTDPNLHVPKRSAKSNIRPIKQPLPSRHQNCAGDRNYANKVLPPIASEREQTLSVASDAQVDSLVQDVCDTDSALSNGEPQPMVNPQTDSNHEDTLNSRLSSLTVSSDSAQDVVTEPCVQTSHPQGSGPDAEEKQQGKLFSLLTDGSSINIPAKVRRAFAKNQQLRKKVLQRDKGRKAKSEDCSLGQKFADKLSQLFDPEEELLYRQQALQCLHTHQQLLQLLTDLGLDRLTEASSAEDILQAKLLAEFVLSSFSAFSEEVHLLSKVQFPPTPAVIPPSHSPPGQTYLWLPASLQGENLYTADSLYYTSKADLTQFMSVLLRLQILQCQHRLLEILISDTLPWLQGLDSGHDEFGAVFRGLFALLSSDGSHLPVLIQDSVE